MSEDFEFDRRGMIARMMALVGATAVSGISADVLAKPAAKSATAARFLDPKRFALLTAIADTIVPVTDTPGAVAAGVPANVDGMLAHWASPRSREMLVEAMTEIDGLAQAHQGKGFAALSPEQRFALLSAHDAVALKQVPRLEKLTGMAAMRAGPSVANPGYSKLKELIVVLYYYSETALTTELPYEAVPGGWTPSLKVTPQTRPMGGVEMF